MANALTKQRMPDGSWIITDGTPVVVASSRDESIIDEIIASHAGGYAGLLKQLCDNAGRQVEVVLRDADGHITDCDVGTHRRAGELALLCIARHVDDGGEAITIEVRPVSQDPRTVIPEALDALYELIPDDWPEDHIIHNIRYIADEREFTISLRHGKKIVIAADALTIEDDE